MALKVGELFASFGIDTKDLDSSIKGIESKCKGIADSLSGIGTKASVAITAPLTLAAKDIYNAGTAFDSEMSKVSAISGATGEDFEALRAAAIEMGSTTSFSAAQSAEALEYMAMAGWKTNQMLDGLPGIMDLAAASGEDLGTVSDIVTDALTAFGMKAEDAGHFSDILAAASSNANTNVSMMGETFKYAAPIAGAMGYSAEDTALAIGLMANSGIKASQAGTSLRRIMTSLNGEIKIEGKELGKVAIQTQNADGSMRGFNDIVMDCREAFKGLSDSEKVAAAETLVGKNAMSGFLAIMNATDEDVEKLTGAINECDGATKRMADTMLDNAKGDVVLFKSAVEGLEITLWGLLEGPFRTGIQTATGWVDSFRKLDSVMQGNILKFAGLAAAAGPAMIALSKFISVATKIGPVIAGLASPLGIVAAGLGLFAIAAIDSKAATQYGFKGMSETIAEFSRTATKGLKKVNKAIPDAMKGVSKAMPIVANFLTSAIKNLVPTIVDTASLVVTGFMNFLGDNATHIAKVGRSIITSLTDGIARNLPQLVPAAARMVTGITSALIKGIPQLISAAGTLVKGLWEGIKNVDWSGLGSQLLDSLGSALMEGRNVLTGFGKDLSKAFSELDMSDVGAKIWEAVSSGFKKVSNLGKMLILGDSYTPDSTWADAGRAIWNAVKNAFTSVSDWGKQLILGKDYTPDSTWADAGGAIWEAIKDGVKTAATAVTDWLIGLVDFTPGEGWEDDGSALWEKIKDGISDEGDWIDGKVTLTLGEKWKLIGKALWLKIKSGISATGDWLKTQLGYKPSDSWKIIGLNLWHKIREGVHDSSDWLKTKLGYNPSDSWKIIGLNLWYKIRDGIHDASDWLKTKLGYEPSDDWTTIGGNLWEKIKEGITDTGDWLKTKLGYDPDDTWSEIGGVIWEKIKTGIHDTGDWLKTRLGYSPSNSWIVIGLDLWHKIRQGIHDTGDWLKTKLGYSPSDDWTTVGADLWGKIKSGIEDAGDWLKTKLNYSPDDSWSDIGADIWAKINTGITNAANGIDSALGLDGTTESIWTSIKGIFSEIAESITTIFGAFSDTRPIEDTGNALNGTFKSAVTAIADALKSVESVLGVFNDIIGKAAELGILDEAIKGIAATLIVLKGVQVVTPLVNLFKAFSAGAKVLLATNPHLLAVAAAITAIVTAVELLKPAWNEMVNGFSEADSNAMGVEGLAAKFGYLSQEMSQLDIRSYEEFVAQFGSLTENMQDSLANNAAFTDDMLATLNAFSEDQWLELYNIYAEGGDNVIQEMTDFILRMQQESETPLEMPEVEGAEETQLEIAETTLTLEGLEGELDALAAMEDPSINIDASGAESAILALKAALGGDTSDIQTYIQGITLGLQTGSIDISTAMQGLFDTIVDEGTAGEARAQALFALIDLGLEPAIVSNIPSFDGKISKAIDSLVDAGIITTEEGFQALAKVIPTSMETGINSGIPQVETAAGNIADIAATTNEKAGIEADAIASGEAADSGLETGIGNNESSVTDAMTSVVDSTKAEADRLKDLLQDVSEEAMTGYETSLQNGEAPASAAMDAVGTAVVNAAMAQMNQDTGYNLGNEFITGITSGLGASGPEGKIASVAANVVSNARRSLSQSIGYSLGSNFSYGIALGIWSGRSNAIQAAIDVATAALASAKSKLAINSPSKVARDEIGAMFDKGLAIGLLENTSTVVSAAKRVTQSLRDSFYVGDPSRGTIYTAQQAARENGAASNSASRAKEIGTAIADRLIETDALGGDIIMGSEVVGRKVTKPVINQRNRDTNKNITGRLAQGVIS